MIPNRIKYALRALLDLSFQPKDGSSQAQAIAQRQSIPLKYLEQILGQLKQEGFLRSRSGPGGGYSLAIPADKITINDVIRRLENNGLQICPRDGSCGCQEINQCAVNSILSEAESAFIEVLKSYTLSDLRNRHEKLNPSDIPNWII